jgi:two-component system LytT family sensor kinase
MMSNRFRFLENYLDSVRQNRLNLFILFLVLPWLVPLVGFLMWGDTYFSSIWIFLGGTLLNLILCLLVNQINQGIATFIATRFPDTHQSILRLTLWFAMYAGVNVIALFLVLFAYNFIHLFGYVMNQNRTLWAVFALLGAALVGSGLSELAYTFMQWKENQSELNQLEQRHIQAELDVVKQQVNPHFLFNCLNSLSVLISEAPSTAEKFVDEMSKVYRYLLQVNGLEHETNLVTLDSEIRFIRSYIYLLETRFESGLQIVIKVANLYLNGQMAPLTLQTLLDNAIRHNIVSSTQPLVICIQTTPNGLLVVKNNLQKRTVKASYNSNGLSTLITRYKVIFNQAGTVQVKEDESSFSVLVPLIHT